MKLKLVEFIEQNPNWHELLTSKPYSITIKDDGTYLLFSYSMIDSDMSLPVVQECRGIILRKDNFKPVCVPFFKFFNVQEGHAAEIDWATAKVQEKVDGSIIKIFYDEVWHVSTNGTIAAGHAQLAMPFETEFGTVDSFGTLFLHALDKQGIPFYELLARLNKNHTTMFELVSPYNRVVVPYPEADLYHIGTRENLTYQELNINIGIKKPASYRLGSLEDCLSAVSQLPFTDEGYVVVDANWNRVKIKSPAYVAAHHLKNNGVVTLSRVVEMIKASSQDDFLSIYPEYSEVFDKVLYSIESFVENVSEEWADISSRNYATRKDLAMSANRTTCPSAIYALADGKVESVTEYLFKQQSDKVLQLIGVK